MKSKDIVSTKSSKPGIKAPMPKLVEPMLASLIARAFDGKDWYFEVKWDGVRAIAFIDKGTLRLQSRNLNDMTLQYPELRRLVAAVKAKTAVLDGEIIAFDEKGRPSFETLQSRINLQDEQAVREMERRIPVVYQIFDILYLDGYDLTSLPFEERRRILSSVVQPNEHWKLSEAVEEKGIVFFDETRRLGLEGIVAKRKNSKYYQGSRGHGWLKIKTVRRQECVVGGFTEGTGYRRGYFGALLLGLYEGDKLVYIGHCGTGFNDEMLGILNAKLKKLETKVKPFAVPVKANQPAHWVKPELVVEIEFIEWTRDSKMRTPAFKGIRYDKNPKECVREIAY
jgi:bifunctional non-homologous end joining protein LigD